ncbi:signal peptidase II [Ferruginibacter sp.]|uniref:signal peptidase II n=1 Tax=Ferruginibacter sp. TaxID=1940288 RepID=UPI00265B002F|nr:signal peptidase II [Ferruginibacter sp.]
MNKKVKILLFCITCFAFISCDRITKDIAKEHLKNKETFSYLHDTIRLEYVENTGAALSLGDNLSVKTSFWLLSILPLIFLLVLFVYTLKNAQKMKTMKFFFLALLFSGGIENIIDRILFDRHVTDFMNVGFENIRTGVFNVADICVTAGAIGLLLFYKNQQEKETVSLL